MSQIYHHGNLRHALLEEASAILQNEGIERLSVRKLADNLGVSRSALYHHFKDKNALLSAITAQQFEKWDAEQDKVCRSGLTHSDLIQAIVHSYLSNALSRAALYNLMFGETLWQKNQADDNLKTIASLSFQRWVERIEGWQKAGYIDGNQPPLRLAQVSWGMMHGLARLLIDGIYVDEKQIDEMSIAVSSLLAK